MRLKDTLHGQLVAMALKPSKNLTLPDGKCSVEAELSLKMVEPYSSSCRSLLTKVGRIKSIGWCPESLGHQWELGQAGQICNLKGDPTGTTQERNCSEFICLSRRQRHGDLVRKQFMDNWLHPYRELVNIPYKLVNRHIFLAEMAPYHAGFNKLNRRKAKNHAF